MQDGERSHILWLSNVSGSTHICAPVHLYVHICVFSYECTHVEWHGNVAQRRVTSPNPNQESSASSPGLGMLAP